MDADKAWSDRRYEVAQWAVARMANRIDRCGGYFVADGGEVRKTTKPADGPCPGFVTSELVADHFRGTDTMVGFHALGADSFGKWAALDLDCHGDPGDDPDANARFALTKYAQLAGMGFRPLLYTSNGAGGYHLLVLFDAPIPGDLLFAFARWMTAEHGGHGLTKTPETFPKQAKIAPGKYGNWLRLIGHHHSKPHWATVWNGSTWLEDGPAIDHVLTLTGDSPALIPPEAYPAPAVEPTTKSVAVHPRGAVASAGIPPGHAYDDAADWPTLLGADGAKLDRELGTGVTSWTRPGKDNGLSATVGHRRNARGTPLLYPFTVNWPGLEPGRFYTPFQFAVAKRFGRIDSGTCKEMAAELIRTGVVSPGRVPRVDIERHRNNTATIAAADVSSDDTSPIDNPPPPMAWNIPARLADGFLRRMTLLFVKKTAFLYDGYRYRVASTERVEAMVTAYCEQEAEAEYRRQVAAREATDEDDKKGRAPAVAPITASLIQNVVRAIKARVQLADDTSLDSWLVGPDGEVPDYPQVMAVANGLLDLRTQTLLPLDSRWFSLTALPMPYLPDAPLPTKFLDMLDFLAGGDADDLGVIQEVFGACLDRSLRLKNYVAFQGAADCGKTAVLTVLYALLGDGNYSTTSMVQLASNRFALFDLFGKLANVVDDESGAELGDEAILRRLTGGGVVNFEEKNKTPFRGPQLAKLVFSTNTLPKLADDVDANWTRLTVIPFKRVVPAARRNPSMRTAEYWTDELPGVLNWALDGLARVVARGGFLAGSDSGREAAEQHRKESDHVRYHLLETYEASRYGLVPNQELYARYVAWCEQNGIREHVRLSSIQLGIRVKGVFPDTEKGHTTDKNRRTINGRKGIRVKETRSVSASDETYDPLEAIRG